MPLPGDLTTATLTFGPYQDSEGVPLGLMTGKLFPVDPTTGQRLNLVHIASGAVVLAQDIAVQVSAETGTASVGPIPHTDNPGLSIVGFAYRVEWTIPSSKPSPGNKTFAVPSTAGTTVDFDLLEVSTTPGVLVPVVTGATGPAGTITSASATSLAAGATPTVTLGGTPSARTLTLGIPAGATGPAGTIESATASALAPGAAPTVTLGGTPSARTMALGIPGATADDASVAALIPGPSATRTALSKVSQRLYNVMEYGAVGNGVANDAPAITAAITAAAAAGGGTVYFPPGTYLSNARILLKTRVNLLGAGRYLSIVKMGTGITTAAFAGLGADTVSDAFYRDLTVDGAYPASGPAGLPGFQVTTGARLTWSNVRVINTSRQGISISGSPDCTVENGVFSANGLDEGGAPHSIAVANGSHRAKIRGNRITGGHGMGISLSTAGNGCTDCEVTGNYISNAASVTGFEAIGISADCVRTVVAGNTILDSQDNGISLTANDCTVTGNTINGALNNGVSVGGSRNSITGNVIKNAGREVSASTYAGVSLAGSSAATANTVTGNNIYDDQTTKTMDYGVRETTGANYNLITGNIVRAGDVITGAILFTGANSVSANNIIA